MPARMRVQRVVLGRISRVRAMWSASRETVVFAATRRGCAVDSMTLIVRQGVPTAHVR